MTTGGWDEEAGRRLMIYLARYPLEHHNNENTNPWVAGKSSEDKQMSRVPESSVKKRPNAERVIKLQKKGTLEVFTRQLSQFPNFADLLTAIPILFPPPSSSSQPRIETFCGDLLTKETEYAERLKPGLHLLISYPPTIDDLPGELRTYPATPAPNALPSSELWGDEVFTRRNDSSNTFFQDLQASTPSPSELRARNKEKKYHLQPPRITFHPVRKTHIRVSLMNSEFPDTFYPLLTDTGAADRVEGLTNSLVYPESESPILSSTIHPGTPAEGPREYTLLKRTTVFPEQPNVELLPPWSPFKIYSNKWQVKDQGFYRVVSGGAFPTTCWDIFAQSCRRRVVCGIDWKFLISPDDGPDLVDAVSGAKKRWLDWKLEDADGKLKTYHQRGSEKRVYANYEAGGDADESLADSEDATATGWWMVPPQRIPRSFTGPGDRLRTFSFPDIQACSEFLRTFLARLGIPDDEIEAFVGYWASRLALDVPGCVVLLKFLHPKELEKLLPVTVTPPPDRFISVFAVFRVVAPEEMEGRRIVAKGILGKEVEILTAGAGACGGGKNCGHGGCFRAFEVGGCQVLGGAPGDDRCEDYTGLEEALRVGDKM